MVRKRPASLSIAAIACCILLFAVGIFFGLKERPANNGPLLNRINVIAPRFGHAPVRAATIETCKEVLRKLPPEIYSTLEEGGATINLAPNIEDNWPGTGDERRPGSVDMTLGEESGRCYDQAVWLYESEKVRGSQKLKPARSQRLMKRNFCQLLGHAINCCMDGMSERKALEKVYDEDVDHMSPQARNHYIEVSQKNKVSRALGCSVIIGALIGGESPMVAYFPRTTEYLKRELNID